ncbi:MAG: hypothetical protein OEY93_01255 [Anaerolineae bacterium]|nr:hypothetical protein [Anaerolineae bacterium]
MNDSTIFQVLLIAALGVLSLNVGLFVLARRGKLVNPKTYETWQKALTSMNDPRKKEENDLKQLSNLVKDLKKDRIDQELSDQ